MFKIDTVTDASSPSWGGLVMGDLPSGTVTLLLADVEGSTRLWETRPEAMAAAVANLDATLLTTVAAHDGVRPLEQGEGDSFVIAFTRASDAVACALALQHADLDPIRLRIGIHTGEIRLRDDQNYIGPTINRTARLRDLGHGGQTLLSSATESLVVDYLPDDVTLTDLGAHALRDLPRAERVFQVNHPEVLNEFPPLRTTDAVGARNIPNQLTTFVGRRRELSELRSMLADHRLVTVTGIGGAGKTRLAIQLANESASEFDDGAWFVDLAPIAAPELLEATVARSLGLPEEPGTPMINAIIRFVHVRRLLLIIDNCEHLVDHCAPLIEALLAASDGLTVLTTSREPVGISGEVNWRMPSLSLTDEAIELFVERARRVRADFTLTDHNQDTVVDICRRLDGLPLAIELAAARVRALTLTEISDSLHDRFLLLTGGSRTAVRRQQTLRASVDWSHALLSDDDRALFRRLSVFVGGFDLAAAQHVCGLTQRYLALDRLTLLVDKSLLIADDAGPESRYRLLETMRQYALEKLGESGEAAEIRDQHRDHFLTIAALLEAPGDAEYDRRLARAEADIDNFRAALGWCTENQHYDLALTLASSLVPLWHSRSHRREGDAWFEWVLDHGQGHIAPAVEARALADKADLEMFSDAIAGAEHAERALAIARETDDRTLLLRALTACLFVLGYDYDNQSSLALFTEAIALARELDDQLRLCQILTIRAGIGVVKGDLVVTRATAKEGRELADALNVDAESRLCQVYLGWALVMQGEIVEARELFSHLASEELVMNQMLLWPGALHGLATAHAFLGDVRSARSVANQLVTVADEVAVYFKGMGYSALSIAGLVDGDIDAAKDAGELAWEYLGVQRQLAVVQRAFSTGVTALATGDIETAKRFANESIAVASGWHLALALIMRGRVAIAEGEWGPADSFTQDALSRIVELRADTWLPDVLECVARVAMADKRSVSASRLFGVADSVRRTTGMVRFAVYKADYDATVAALRTALTDEQFDAAWAEGAAMTIEEAVAYAQRGRVDRKRPTSGWDSLTPAELDVVRLVADGLTNKDVAARLFISPRTVQAHLAHVFTKLAVTTRTQLAQEATKRAAANAS